MSRPFTIPTECFPLAWPVGRPRTKFPQRTTVLARDVTLAAAIDRVYAELRRMKASGAVISSNLPTRTDGTPRGDQLPRGDDHGVAVYWYTTATRGGHTVKVPQVMSCDRWAHVRQNMQAIAKSLEALRGVERWGAVTLEQAFAGFAALPPGDGTDKPPERTWREVLDVPSTGWTETAPAMVVLDFAKRQHRALIRQHHPDAGGDPAVAAEINRALELAEAELGGG